MVIGENFDLKKIPSEIKCINILKKIIINQGLICSRCDCKDFYWKNDKLSFECKNCNKRHSLKINTLMERSQLPIYFWVVALHYRLNKRNESISNIQKFLSHSRYETIFEIVRKIDTQIKRRIPVVDSEYDIITDLDDKIFSNKINFMFGDFKNDTEFYEKQIFHYLKILSLKPIFY